MRFLRIYRILRFVVAIVLLTYILLLFLNRYNIIGYEMILYFGIAVLCILLVFIIMSIIKMIRFDDKRN